MFQIRTAPDNVNLLTDRLLKKFKTDLGIMNSLNVNVRFSVLTSGEIHRQARVKRQVKKIGVNFGRKHFRQQSSLPMVSGR
jgi:hypothetical protein